MRNRETEVYRERERKVLVWWKPQIQPCLKLEAPRHVSNVSNRSHGFPFLFMAEL